MRGWTGLPLAPDVSLQVRSDMPVLPDWLESAIAAIWQDECVRRPALFNGRVFCADRIEPSRIEGHWTEYRRVLAQMRRPDWFAQMRIRALAVNGLVECVEGLVLGRRQAAAVYLPGCWQAAPAGNVEARTGDTLDLSDQLLAELAEELGLGADDVEALRPVAAIEHADTHIVDVGFLLQTPFRFQQIEQRRAECGNDEYDALQLVPRNGIDRFLAEAGPTLLPSARILIGCWMKR